MYDENRRLCVCTEGFASGELIDIYTAMGTFLRKYAPKRLLEDVRILSGDGFFDEKLTADIEFTNAQFIADHWHLSDAGLEKWFGKKQYALVHHFMLRLINANSKTEFDDLFHGALELVWAQDNIDESILSNLHEFAERKHTFATYKLRLISGNHGRHGSVALEVNHSSVPCYLNGGHTATNQFCVDACETAKELSERQRKHVLLANEQLFNDDISMRMEIDRLRAEQQTPGTRDFIKAATKLGKATYVRYKQARSRISEYKRDVQFNHHQESQSETIVITSIINPDAPPRVFHSRMERCSCRARIVKEEMCTHEVRAWGSFQADLFVEQHFKRTRVTEPLNGWTAPTPDENTTEELVEEEQVPAQPINTPNSNEGEPFVVG